MNDSDANLLAYLENWIAKKDVITRNSEILKALAKLPSAQKKPQLIVLTPLRIFTTRNWIH